MSGVAVPFHLNFKSMQDIVLDFFLLVPSPPRHNKVNIQETLADDHPVKTH